MEIGVLWGKIEGRGKQQRGQSYIFTSSEIGSRLTSVKTRFFFVGMGIYSLLSITSQRFRTNGIVAERVAVSER